MQIIIVSITNKNVEVIINMVIFMMNKNLPSNIPSS